MFDLLNRIKKFICNHNYKQSHKLTIQIMYLANNKKIVKNNFS